MNSIRMSLVGQKKYWWEKLKIPPKRNVLCYWDDENKEIIGGLVAIFNLTYYDSSISHKVSGEFETKE